MTLSRKGAKSRTRGRKLHLTGTKARVARTRQTRADLEQQLKAGRREIAHARERLAEAMKQQTATSGVLRIISSSPAEIQPVLDAVAENAARLCDANNAVIFRLEDNLLRLVASYGKIPTTSRARKAVPANRDTVIGRATCDRRTIHVHDLAAQDSEYPVGSRDAKREGHRTTLATPLLREAARSRRSTRPSPTGWEWGCRSPVGSSRRTVDGYGPRPTRRAVLPFSSRCLRAGRARRDAAPLSPKRRVRFLRTMPPFPTPKFGAIGVNGHRAEASGALIWRD